MTDIIFIVQIILSILLAAAILLQSRGAGLGQAWGGGGGGGESYRSKRGMEKLLFRATIVLAVAFFAWSILSAVV